MTMPPDFGPARVGEYRDAVLTASQIRPTARGIRSRLRIACGRAPHHWDVTGHRFLGAVYADGRLVPESLRDSFPGHEVVDPRSLPSGVATNTRLTGTWLYGGHWMAHFGHFLLESLSTLWPEPDGSYSGIVFHIWPADHHAIEPTEWQRWLVRRTGWDIPIHVVGHDATTVEHLLVPTRAYRLHRGPLPELVAMWDRIAPPQPAGRPVFLSRSRLAQDSRRTNGDEELDEALAELGLEVVHPQELHIEEQVAVASRASTLVGLGGSQLHLSMFARSCSKIIEIGDLRLPDRAVPDQLCLAEARGHEHHLVPRMLSNGRRDIPATVERVRSIGF